MNEYLVKFLQKSKYSPTERNITVQTSGSHMDAAGLIHQQFGSNKHITLQTSTNTKNGEVFDFAESEVVTQEPEAEVNVEITQEAGGNNE